MLALSSGSGYALVEALGIAPEQHAVRRHGSPVLVAVPGPGGLACIVQLQHAVPKAGFSAGQELSWLDLDHIHTRKLAPGLCNA